MTVRFENESTARPFQKRAMSPRGSVLPDSLAPRGLSRVESAAYLGISATLFDALVQEGVMPKPKRLHARAVWDRRRLDEAWDALPDENEVNPWDEPTAP